MTDGLDKFLAGDTEAFGGPAANNNAARRSRPDIILLALSVGVVLGFGALAIVIVHIAVSKRPVTAMPVIAAEAQDARKDPSRSSEAGTNLSTCPDSFPFPSASTGAAPSTPAPSTPVPSTPAPSTMLGTMASHSFKAAAARAQLTAWWAASHANRRMPGVARERAYAARPRRDVPIPMPTPMPPPQDFGCPASLGAACAAQR